MTEVCRIVLVVALVLTGGATYSQTKIDEPYRKEVHPGCCGELGTIRYLNRQSGALLGSSLYSDLLNIRVDGHSLNRYVAFEGSAAAERVGLKASDGTLFVFDADRLLQALSISSATAGADCFALKFHFAGHEAWKELVIHGRKNLVGEKLFLEVACMYSGPAGSMTIPFGEDILDVEHAVHEGNIRIEDITRRLVGH